MPTAFGSPLGRPQDAAAVLRALASRHGLELQPTSEIDSAAAVIAADIWARLTGVSDLARAATAGSGPAEAASRILARAAGYGDAGRQWLTGPGQGSDMVLSMLDHYWAWGATHLGPEGTRRALWRAGHDLAAGGDRLAQAGGALQMFADEADAADPSRR